MLIKPKPLALAMMMMLATPAWSLTLGAPQALSSADAPLVADIPLFDAQDIQADAIVVRHASAIEYELQGLASPIDLGDITVGIVVGADNRRSVQVQLSKPLTVKRALLLNISWPGKTLMQPVELDPASLAPRTAVKPAIETIAISVPVAVATPSAVVVKPGDSLSKIASEWDQDLTLLQREKLIYDANNKAFVGGSINRIKSGAKLRLPDVTTVTVPSPAKARAWYQQALAKAEGRTTEATTHRSLPAPIVAAKPTAKPAPIASAKPVEAPTPITTIPVEQGNQEPNVKLLSVPKSAATTSLGTDEQVTGAPAIGATAPTDVAAEESTRQYKKLVIQREELRARLTNLTQENQDWDNRLSLVNEQIAALEEAAKQPSAPIPENEPAPTLDAPTADLETPTAPAALAGAEIKPADEAPPEASFWSTFMYPLIGTGLALLAFLAWMVFANRRSKPVMEDVPSYAPTPEPVVAPTAEPAPAPQPEPTADAKPILVPASEHTQPMVDAPLNPEPMPAVDEPVTDEPDADFAQLLAESQQAATEADESEYDVLEQSDSASMQTRLDLAKAYLDMNEPDAARDLLNDVIRQGDAEMQAKAQAMLAQLS